MTPTRKEQLERIEQAYADDLLPIVAPKEIAIHLNPTLCAWVRTFAKHWYVLGRNDAEGELVEPLKFYADPHNWSDLNVVESQIELDEGHRARVALNANREEK